MPNAASGESGAMKSSEKASSARLPKRSTDLSGVPKGVSWKFLEEGHEARS
jgi:hypothetical protein